MTHLHSNIHNNKKENELGTQYYIITSSVIINNMFFYKKDHTVSKMNKTIVNIWLTKT